MRLGFPHEVVEDALLTAVLKLMHSEARRELRRDSVFALLWVTAYRSAIDEVRKRHLECPLETPNHEDGAPRDFVSPVADPERQTILKTDLGRCLEKLPAVERAIVLHKHFGQSAQEISALVGIASADSVNTRYCQACKKLRECLESGGSYGTRGARGGAHGQYR
jgi:RNA polymerase sigma factor (sigma-70 family)